MAIIKMCNPSLSADIEALELRISALEKGNFASAPPKVEERAAEAITEEPEISQENENEDYNEEIPLPTEEDLPPSEPTEDATASKEPISDELTELSRWKEVLSRLTVECPLIAGVLKGSKAYTKGDFLLIDAPNSQFRSLINSGNAYYKNSIRKAALSVLGHTYKLGPYSPEKPKDETDPLTQLAERLKNFEIN